MSVTEDILLSLSGDSLAGLRRADRLWQTYQQDSLPQVEVISQSDKLLCSVDWDVVICGGTLGILIGAALAQRGWRVALLERGKLRGREQEWNISRKELASFVELGLLSAEELEQAIATSYNPARISFHQGVELWVRDVLNIGVDPVFLLDALKAKFLAAGGYLSEHTSFETAVIHPDGVTVHARQTFKARLLLDAMGHFSPIVQQARGGQRPDAVCLVVGSCAQGFPTNETGDLLVSFTPMKDQCQYFWEAFPARDGRTTYLFTYLDMGGDRTASTSYPTLETLFEDYFTLMPTYQGVELNNLTFQRVLFGFFPCYRNSPLHVSWPRILAIGDSSGSQSPLSFGGFGSMVRHLERLVHGIQAALQADLLTPTALNALQPYQPNLSVTWLFQKAMSAKPGQSIDPNQINQLLSAVFQEMQQLGDSVLKPFLQDVVQFPALFQTLMKTAVAHPALVLKIIPHVGLPALLNWIWHYGNLAGYTALYPLSQPLAPWAKTLSPQLQYYVHRWIDALKYGSGADYSAPAISKE
jgi:lycopene cyclase CruP